MVTTGQGQVSPSPLTVSSLQGRVLAHSKLQLGSQTLTQAWGTFTRPFVVVLTTPNPSPYPQVTIFWGQVGAQELHIIWGSGPAPGLLQEGVQWAVAPPGQGRYHVPSGGAVAPQHLFLATRDREGRSAGMRAVDCRLVQGRLYTSRLTQSNLDTASYECLFGL